MAAEGRFDRLAIRQLETSLRIYMLGNARRSSELRPAIPAIPSVKLKRDPRVPDGPNVANGRAACERWLGCGRAANPVPQIAWQVGRELRRDASAVGPTL
jgi:hypothetical protein